ncbi:MAG TPA: hypothetical protein PLV21_14075 [Cyclobacteriaceae bacterium]|nr:hypothetical protein [Cyclobacteriaceae bacterium]HRJ83013.1 hypothetical protein [Cyclobacteriaceae bacterium]
MSIASIPPEDKDFALLDRYTQFSAELVKLAMAAIGAVWIIVITTKKTPDDTLVFSLSDSFYLKSFLSCLFLIMAVLCGLAHRCVATDFDG